MPDPGYLPIDPDLLPTPNGVRKPQTHGPIASGPVRGALDLLGGTLGAAVEGAGKYFGAPTIQQVGQGIQDYTQSAAPSYNRPDLDIAPWKPGGAHVVPWLEYNVGKQIPLLGAYMLGAKGLARAGVEAPAALARVGAQTPRVLGGGGLRAGASFAERRAALAAGKDFAQTALGAEAVGIPIAAGSMYQEADNKPGGATREDALKAAALSPFYAALDAVEPAQLKGLVSRGLAGGVVKRAVTAGLVSSASEVVQEGIQTALEQSFRMDLPIKDRMANIVDAAVTGGAVGGIFGGAGAAIGGNHPELRALKRADPNQITNEDLKQLQLPSPGQSGAVAPNAQVNVSPAGEAEVEPQYQDVVRPQSTRPYGSVDANGEYTTTTVELAKGLGAAQKRIEAGTATDEINRFVQAAHDELAIRNGVVSNNNVDRIAVGAVEPNLDDVSGGADSSGAPAPTSPNLNDLFKGVSPAARKAYAGAQTIEDIAKINNDLLAAGTAAKGHLLIAERLGVDLNEPAAPLEAEEPRVQAATGTATPLATAPITQEDTPEPAAPASQRGGDPSVQAKLKGLMGVSIRDLRENPPQTKDEARLRLYKMWGGEGPQETSARDGLETALRRFNMLKKDGQLSAVGRRIAHQAISTEEAVQGAVDAGHSSHAAAFEAGARAAVVKDAPRYDNLGDAMAFMAGHDWAIPKVASQEETSAMVGTLRASVPKLQQRQAIFNKVIDGLGINASIKPSEVAQLKSMVREGASSRDIQSALERVQKGGSLFQEQERQPPAPFKGETVTPSLLTAARQQRQQANAQAIAEHDLGKGARKQQMANAVEEHQRYKGQLRQAIREAAESGEITRKQQIGLIHRLITNDLKGVEEGLQSPQKVSRRDFMAGVAATAAVTVGVGPVKADTLEHTPPAEGLRGFIDRNDARGVLEHIKSTSKNPRYRLIANKLLRGDPGKIDIAWGNSDLDDNYAGLTKLQDDGSSSVFIYSKGLNEETVLHELIHAYAQQRWAGLSLYDQGNKRVMGDAVNRGDAVIQRWQDLWEKVGNSLKKTNPELVEKEVWATEVYRSPDEMLSWVLTNPEAQAYLRTVDENGEKIRTEPSLWDNIIGFFRSLFGLPANAQVTNALDTLLSAGYSVLDAGVAVKTGDYNTKLVKELAEENESPMRLSPTVVSQDIGRGVRSVISSTEGALKSQAAQGVVRKNFLGIPSLHGILEYWGKWFDHENQNGLALVEKAHGEKRAIVERFAQMMTNIRDEYEKLRTTNKDSAEKIVQLMQTTQFGINYTHPWHEQSEEIRNSPNRANLERITNEAHTMYRSLQARGHAGTINTLRAVNDVLMLAQESVALHLQAVSDPYAKDAFSGDPPMDAFMKQQTLQDFDPHTAREWWADRLRVQLAQMSSYLGSQRALRDNPDSGLNEKAKENLKTHISDFGEKIGSIQDMMKHLEETPYFHLGRSGEFFVNFKVPDAESMSAIADRLEAKKFPAVISRGTDKNSAYIRVESRSEWGNLVSEVEAMERDGLLSDVTSGQRKKDMAQLAGKISSSQMLKLIHKIENNDDIDPSVRGVSAEILRAAAVDFMPEMSVSRVLTHRKNIPGFSPDMMRSFDWRGQVGVNALAGMSTAAKISEALNHMRNALEVAEGSPSSSVSLNQKSGMRDILNEVVLRERNSATLPESKWAERIGSISTAWFLGFSPAYGAVNLTQLAATLLPELGAKHGFGRAFSEIAKATPAAFRIMRGVWAHGRAVSLDRAMDAVVTYDVLKNAVGEGMAQYLMRVVNSGQIDIGGPSRELMRFAEGRGDSKLDRGLRWAAMIGYYTETMSRLIAAIATRQLNPNMSVDEASDRASQVIKETMWDYSRANQGRVFGKGGPFGPVTPLMTKFLQYQAQLTEKLYREVHEAFRGETAEQRSEARRYLAGHLSAMTVLAGTMGWPMVTAFAAAFDKLKDLFDDDDEPSNVRAAYRNWLADTFGADAGELIAHGALRETGADVSQRIGEQDIVPYSRFLADRRSFKDSFKDAAFRSWGAPVNAMSNIAQGAEKFLDGNITDGLAQMTPTFLAAPTKAYRLTSEGFVDGNGKALPMTPGARDILVQLLGFNPATAAEDSEARGYQASRKGVLAKKGAVLRNQIADAILTGDTETARDLIEQAQKFDQANPHFSVLRGLESSIKRRAAAETISRATGTPLGVSYRDPGGLELTRYANVDYQT